MKCTFSYVKTIFLLLNQGKNQKSSLIIEVVIDFLLSRGCFCFKKFDIQIRFLKNHNSK